MTPSHPPLIAVDVGNNRVKLGLFDGAAGRKCGHLPEPGRTLTVAGDGAGLDGILNWLGPLEPSHVAWWIGSVNRPSATRLVDWLRNQAPAGNVTLLASGDLPLRVALERPDRVGIDRLLDALAANHLREPDRPAIVVDVGTAITVDLVSADGVFQGGAIAPGLAMVARALHDYTDMLPLVEAELSSPPPAVGDSTVAALHSGMFWGGVGTIRELITRMTPGGGPRPAVFLTGGASPAVAQLLGPEARHVPHLTLAGIALAAQSPIPNPSSSPPHCTPRSSET
jgi:type III pantothenate kinase